ncbi:hypothetical protein SAMN05421839_1064 [Halolactibacillus halophilus]|uniref:Uncharacterized protein n=1 Tax=Halolactibacillus halophilus TaxID=306540 RepID=A0A1I5ML12_9BACI|nr:hypothetical protein [Halolactibacillus halophilus]GEM02495.1 hypothetical protein HHA03_20270 [Halolactibacillus halophilus]SFP10203.1 hypothetical protein SAMN05421839_1064 [Halolactibacillus halophilus]
MQYIMSLSLKRASKLLNKAVEEKQKEETYALWLVRYSSYTEETFETFEEFYEKLYPPKIEMDTRNKDEIMSELLGKEER